MIVTGGDREKQTDSKQHQRKKQACPEGMKEQLQFRGEVDPQGIMQKTKTLSLQNHVSLTNQNLSSNSIGKNSNYN